MPSALSQMFVALPIISRSSDAEQLMRQGKEYYRQGEFENSITVLKKAILELERQNAGWSNQAIARIDLILAYEQLGQVEDGYRIVQETLGKNILPKNFTQLKQRDIVAQFWNIKSNLEMKQGKLEQALESWVISVSPYQDNKNLHNSSITQKYSDYYKPEIIQQLGSLETIPPRLQSKFLRNLGDISRLMGYLTQSEEILNRSKDTAKSNEEKSAALLSLGNNLWEQGNLEKNRKAPTNYEYMPWGCSKAINLQSVARAFYEKAINTYLGYDTSGKEQYLSEDLFPHMIKTKRDLNLLQLYIQEGELQAADKLIKKINLDILPKSRTKVYERIKLTKNLACLSPEKDRNILLDNSQLINSLINNLNQAIQDAQDLKDISTESYARGNLAGLYEYLATIAPQQQNNLAKDWQGKAIEETQKALYLAQLTKSDEIIYQWKWQLGRLFKAQNNILDAIKQYEGAAKTLESVRGDLLSFGTDVQFNFRDNIEPLYRELISILLSGETTISPENIQKSLYYAESIQLAELENFLKCNLREIDINSKKGQSLNAKNNQMTKLNEKIDEVLANEVARISHGELKTQKSAFIFPIILKDRLAVIWKFHSHNKSQIDPGCYNSDRDNIMTCYSTEKISQTQLEEILKDAKNAAADTDAFTNNDREIFQKLYNYILKAYDRNLQDNQVKTLRFVLDGTLRNIPISLLYDGEKYLVEKYALTISPTIRLLNRIPFKAPHIQALIGGSSEIPEDQRGLFQEIPAEQLKNQIQETESILKGHHVKTMTLQTPNFTTENIKNTLKSSVYTLVYLIAHGQFSSNFKETYILTDNKQLNILEFGDLLQPRDQSKPPVDLLLLSSCTTARGDNRAILGIAGTSVKSGASTTIAPLWNVDQSATDRLIKDFFRELVKSNITKAEALHLVQKAKAEALRQYQEGSSPQDDSAQNLPYYWAGLIVVGDY